MKPHLTSVTHGYFAIPSGIVVISGDLAPLAEIAKSYPETIRRVTAAPWIEVLDVSNRVNLSQQVIQAELTRRHEFAHYRQLMSTPLGLLLWRTQNVLVSDVTFVIRAATDLRPIQRIKLPVDEWLIGGGLKQLMRAAEVGAKFVPTRVSKWKNPTETAQYLEHLLHEIGILRWFLEGLLERATLTVGKFVEIANLCFEILQRHSDTSFAARWCSRLPPDTPLIADGRFSGTEMIEASARLEERLFFAPLDNAAQRIERWELSAIHGVYEPAYRWLLQQLGDARAALAVVDTAFMSPIDPAFAAACGGNLIVEDVLPSFRLARLVSTARNEFWPVAGKQLDDLLGHLLCERAGLLAPSDVVRQGLSTSYSGKDSWDYDFRTSGLPKTLNLGPVFDHAQNEVRRAMVIRSRSAAAFTSEDWEVSGPFRPLLCFYRDRVVTGFDALADKKDYLGGRAPYLDGFLLFLKSYWKFVGDGLALALLEDGDVSELRRCEQAIKQRAAHGNSPYDLFPAFFQALESVDDRVKGRGLELLDLRELARGLVGEDHLSLLGL